MTPIIVLYLTPQIIKREGNVVFHCEWDNLNKITTNLLGSSIVNSAGGIMLQEVRPGFDNVCARTLPVYRKSNQRSHSVDTPATPLNFNRIVPNLPDVCIFTPPLQIARILRLALRQIYWKQQSSICAWVWLVYICH